MLFQLLRKRRDSMNEKSVICYHLCGKTISTLWQKFTHTNFTTRPRRRGFTWGIVPKKQVPLRILGGESEGLRKNELLQK